MEFDGQYLTYEEYKALGGTLNLTSFNLLEFEARNQIDSRTQNRLLNVEEIPFKVKICAFHLINKIDGYIKTIDNIRNNGNITGFNSDGYSESYASSNQIKEIIQSKEKEVDDLILTDLYGVIVNNQAILYNGVH